MIRINEKGGQVPSEQLMHDMGKLIDEMTREGVTSDHNRQQICGAPAMNEVYPAARRRPGASRCSAPSGLRPGLLLRAGKAGTCRRQC
jgi:hypothetical protein